MGCVSVWFAIHYAFSIAIVAGYYAHCVCWCAAYWNEQMPQMIQTHQIHSFSNIKYTVGLTVHYAYLCKTVKATHSNSENNFVRVVYHMSRFHSHRIQIKCRISIRRQQRCRTESACWRKLCSDFHYVASRQFRQLETHCIWFFELRKNGITLLRKTGDLVSTKTSGTTHINSIARSFFN